MLAGRHGHGACVALLRKNSATMAISDDSEEDEDSDEQGGFAGGRRQIPPLLVQSSSGSSIGGAEQLKFKLPSRSPASSDTRTFSLPSSRRSSSAGAGAGARVGAVGGGRGVGEGGAGVGIGSVGEGRVQKQVEMGRPGLPPGHGRVEGHRENADGKTLSVPPTAKATGTPNPSQTARELLEKKDREVDALQQ